MTTTHELTNRTTKVALSGGSRVTRPASLQAVTAFWAAHLGCHPAQLSEAGTAVVRNGPGLADYRGATAFHRPPA